MLYLAVFTSGMCTLAIEITASRLLGYVFGTSNPIWAAVIGLTLLYLTAGYFLGGRWADRSPHFATLYRIIIWGAFAAGLMPLIGRPILSVAGSAMIGFHVSAAIGAFVAVLVLFAVPVTLLGCVSPFAIRLAIPSVTDAGKAAGRMYALSTLGSILGTFIPALWMIPELGTTLTFMVFSLSLLVVGLIGLALQSRRAALRLAWMPPLLLALTVLVLNGPLRPPPPGTVLLYEKESPYNYIQVVSYTERNGSETRLLLLNEGQGIHSQWNDKTLYYGRTWDYFMTAPFFNNAPYNPSNIKSAAVVGLAAGTIARQYTDVFGPVAIDGIEIDADIVKAGQQFFQMNEPNLNVIVEDGRLAMHNSTNKYDVVGLDAYRVPYVPWNLTTVEFFQDVRAHLTSQGVAVINVGRTVNAATGTQDRRLIQAMTNTMQHVFPSVYTIDVPGSFNTILIATVQPTSAGNLAANLAALPTDADPILRTVLDSAVKNMKPTVASDVLFTDDRAPVETIVDSMVLDFLSGGGAGQFAR
jgi:predicted membrane-bound spermidine synthase